MKKGFVKAIFDGTESASHAQALWRFLSNDQVSPECLARPLLAVAHQSVRDDCDGFALCVHDWSRINYSTHTGKLDRKQMTHDTDVGYELQSSLLVSDRDGVPLVAPVQNWVTGDGVWQTRAEGLQADDQTHLDELTGRMGWLEDQGFALPLGHIIDREADSDRALAGVGRGGPAMRGTGQGRVACPLRQARLHPVVRGGGLGIRAGTGSGLQRPARRAMGGQRRSGSHAACKTQAERRPRPPGGADSRQAVESAAGRQPDSGCRGEHRRRVVSADQRGKVRRGREDCLMVLLSLADRIVLQAAQDGGPSAGILGAGNRTGAVQTPADRHPIVRAGVAADAGNR